MRYSRDLVVDRTTIRHAIVAQSARHPATLVSAGLGVSAVGAGALLGLGWVAIVAGSALIPAGFLFNSLFRAGTFQGRFLRDVELELQRNRQKRFGEVRADLYDLANQLPAKDEAGDLAAAALVQFNDGHDKFDRFMEALDRKLYPGELAHARNHAAANEFILKIVEQLGYASELIAMGVDDRDSELRQDQLSAVRGLLSDNQKALDAFENSLFRVVQLKDIEHTSSAEIEEIVHQLETLAAQVDRLKS